MVGSTVVSSYADNVKQDVPTGTLARDGSLVRTSPSGPVLAGAILRRPDVAATVARYRSAVAEIGVAEAMRWPELQLIGYGGQLSSSFHDPVGSDASRYGLSADMRTPILDGGESKARYKIAMARAEEASAVYASTVTKALREVGEVNDRLQNARRTSENLDTLAKISSEKISRPSKGWLLERHRGRNCGDTGSNKQASESTRWRTGAAFSWR